MVEAGGRCEFAGCNKYLCEHHLTLTRGFFGQHAHIVAFSKLGPRAGVPTGFEDVHALENLMLLCTACHKLVDDNPDDFPIELLRNYKNHHECRIRHLTSLGPESKTEIVQLKAEVAGQHVSIPAEKLFAAVSPRYPTDKKGWVVDLSALRAEESTFYGSAEKVIRRNVEELLSASLNGEKPLHLSVFALAPIPALVLFGAVLGNKISSDIYQRHRDTQDWTWKKSGPIVEFEVTKPVDGQGGGRIVLALSLSGHVAYSELFIADADTVYEISPSGCSPTPTLLRRREDLANFLAAYEKCLVRIRKENPNLKELHLLPAVPVPAAIHCGTALLPKIDPVVHVYDFDKINGFQCRIKVNNYDPE